MSLKTIASQEKSDTAVCVENAVRILSDYLRRMGSHAIILVADGITNGDLILLSAEDYPSASKAA